MATTIDLTLQEKGVDALGRSFEKTFVVAVPVERAWEAMTDPAELNKWYFPVRTADDGSIQTEVLGAERKTEVVAFEPGRMFRTRTTLTGEEGPFIVPGTREMTVVFESLESGTRITITNSGFGADQDMSGMIRGQEETIADLMLYLETGVAFPRHHQGVRSWVGFSGAERRSGLEVQAVQAQSFAGRIGLRPGDIIVELGGASVFTLAEVQFFTKEHAPGERADAAWIRDGQLMRGSAELGAQAP